MSRGLIGLVILSVLTISGIFADALPLSDPEVTNLDGRLTPPTWSSGEYMLGSDQLGRDILSRIIYGARVSLIVGFSTVFIAGTIGVTLGMLAGYFGRWADHIIMRVLDVVQAFPFLVLALALVAVLRPSLKSTVVILSIWGWTAYCRPVRSITLSLREKEYVAASHVVGCSSLRILVRHMLPNCIPLILVLATFQIAQLIVAESALSFLGLGIPPPTPSWGTMIGEGRQYVSSAWWVTTFPGVVLTLAVLGIGFIGDWLRDTLDPKMKV